MALLKATVDIYRYGINHESTNNIVKLIKTCKNVNAKHMDITPLYCVLFANDNGRDMSHCVLTLVRELLSAGADPDIQYRGFHENGTVLTIWIERMLRNRYKHSEDIFKELVKVSNVNIKNTWGTGSNLITHVISLSTHAMSNTTHRPILPIIKHLLRKGIDMNIKDYHGVTGYEFAKRWYNSYNYACLLPVVQYLDFYKVMITFMGINQQKQKQIFPSDLFRKLATFLY
jgi:hypothetical protein